MTTYRQPVSPWSTTTPGDNVTVCLCQVDSDVRVHRLECLRDGGILDPDDRICDVFDETKDQVQRWLPPPPATDPLPRLGPFQILAIYDEQSPNGSGLGSNQIISPVPSSSYSSFSTTSTGLPLMTSSPVAGSRQGPFLSPHHPILSISGPRPTSSYYSTPSPLYSGLGQSASMDFPNGSRGYSNPPPAYTGKIRDSVVEVKNANSLPCELSSSPSRLLVPFPANGLMVYSPSDGAIANSPPVRSSLRSGSSTPSRTHRVTLSPGSLFYPIKYYTLL